MSGSLTYISEWHKAPRQVPPPRAEVETTPDVLSMAQSRINENLDQIASCLGYNTMQLGNVVPEVVFTGGNSKDALDYCSDGTVIAVKNPSKKGATIKITDGVALFFARNRDGDINFGAAEATLFATALAIGYITQANQISSIRRYGFDENVWGGIIQPANVQPFRIAAGIVNRVHGDINSKDVVVSEATNGVRPHSLAFRNPISGISLKQAVSPYFRFT